MRVLISGGAGLIGSALVAKLIRRNDDVTVMDNLSPQVHGRGPHRLSESFPQVRLLRSDVRDLTAWNDALQDQDAIVHLAAETGTGQSMYSIGLYEQVNVGGTANLFDALISAGRINIQRIVLASSRSVYGEGAYYCSGDGQVYPGAAEIESKLCGRFDPVCPRCKGVCFPVPTPEDAPCNPLSFYGLTKCMQEKITFHCAKALGISAIALRFQNVYGPKQSFYNPYSGILPLFAGLAQSGHDIQVFEDGLESRDFVYVEDAVDAIVASLSLNLPGNNIINIGSGESQSLLGIAARINEWYGQASRILVSGIFREGDIRHASANLNQARKVLEYKAKWTFKDGLDDFLRRAETADHGLKRRHDRSLNELKAVNCLHQQKSAKQ